MSNPIGGFGNNQSNNIYFKYQATKEIEGNKVPVGKLVRWVKETKTEEFYEWLAGELVHVGYRLNEGKPDAGVDPYNELILTLRGVDRSGEVWFYKLPLRASGIAAYGVTRRLHHFEAGDPVHIGTGVIDDQPNLWIQAIEDDGARTKLEPVDPGLSFVSTEGLTGAKLQAARTQNAALREEWVESTVKQFAFFDDGNGSSNRKYVSAQNVDPIASHPTAGAEDEYDPFSDD